MLIILLHAVCSDSKCLQFVFVKLTDRDIRVITRLAVDMDIHGYIHVWISDLGHLVDTSMVAHFSIKLNTRSTNDRKNKDYEHQRKREKRSSIQEFDQINLLSLHQ